MQCGSPVASPDVGDRTESVNDYGKGDRVLHPEHVSEKGGLDPARTTRESNRVLPGGKEVGLNCIHAADGERVMLTINLEKLKDLAIVRCVGRIVRGENISTLKGSLIAANDTRLIVIDLSEVDTIDAAGLSALVSLHHWSRSRGIQLRLLNPSRFVLQVLNRTKLSSVFDISSLHNALAAIVGTRYSESTMSSGSSANSGECKCLISTVNASKLMQSGLMVLPRFMVSARLFCAGSGRLPRRRHVSEGDR